MCIFVLYNFEPFQDRSLMLHAVSVYVCFADDIV